MLDISNEATLLKIILSRKGFDSENGGYSSPILPDGRLLSLPIPSEDDNRYSDLLLEDTISYFDIMQRLNPDIRVNKKWTPITSETHCHVDPDIFQSVRPRQPGWKAIFGQANAAQTHLSNKSVSVGDVFLFFGWFRRTIMADNKMIFAKDAQDQHIIFGYLEIGEPPHAISKNEDVEFPDWMRSHPHLQHTYKTNAVYVAKERLSWNEKYSGWGIFNFHNDLVLTKEGQYSRSKWNLLEIFKGVDISYHSQNSWKSDYFQSAAIGQEFVIKCTQDIEDWTKRIVEKHARP